MIALVLSFQNIAQKKKYLNLKNILVRQLDSRIQKVRIFVVPQALEYPAIPPNIF